MTTSAEWYGGICEECQRGMWKQGAKDFLKPVDAPKDYRRCHKHGLCNTCAQRLRREQNRTTPRKLNNADFAEEFHFLRSQGMTYPEIARSIGIATVSLRQRLSRIGVHDYNSDEQMVHDWIVRYCEQGIQFTVDSLPFCEDKGTHQRVLNNVIREGRLRRTGEKKKSPLDMHTSSTQHIYEPVG